MACEETTQLLSQFIDDVLSTPARAAVDEHLDRCPVCRARVAELRSISRSLRQLSRPIAPTELAPAITAALMIEAAALRQSPARSFGQRISLWLEPRLMPYSEAQATARYAGQRSARETGGGRPLQSSAQQ